MKILDLFTYPIKSTIGIKVEDIEVTKTGFKYDRDFAVINANNQVLTVRENPKLLLISSEIKASTIQLKGGGKNTTEIEYTNNESIDITIFNKHAKGKLISSKADKWLSEILEEESKLIKIDSANLRGIQPKYIGENPNKITFSDAFPIHLVSEKSVANLNSKLENPVNAKRFRPNIVVSGEIAFEEDHWKKVTIGECEFDIVHKTQRCSLLTVNPETIETSPKQEPLRTLSKYRKDDGGVNFGMYLIPTKLGTIKSSDKIEIS